MASPPPSPRLLRIGALARATGLSPDSLRLYERRGLLPAPSRTAGGFREYPPSAERRVRVIQAALALGFSLEELGGVLRQRDAGGAPCRQVRALAGEKLVALEARLAELRALRRALRDTLADWDGRLAGAPAGTRVGLLEALAAAVADRATAPRPARPARRLAGRTSTRPRLREPGREAPRRVPSRTVPGSRRPSG
jgi:DNA-binding transcriptional MerR regulator